MKAIAEFFFGAVVGCATVAAQGTVNFSNRVTTASPPLDQPLYCLGVKLSGPAYVAQLLVGRPGHSLTPVGVASLFRTGAGAGYWVSNPSLVVPNLPGGTVVVASVAIWDSRGGATYDEAVASGVRVGRSDPFEMRLGGDGVPPSLPAAMNGFRSFDLCIPEPGSPWLLALGLFAVAQFRRGRG